MMITLSCLVQCDNPNKKNIFKIEIESDKPVSKLKEEIRKKRYNNFVNVGADELQLWKVNIPLNEQNNKLNILNTRPCASIKEELEGEEMDAKRNVGEYFSNRFANENIHIIVQRERINVVLFGLTGHGKSSIANMLVQGDLRQNNAFKVDNGAKGETINIVSGVNEVFQVFDTVGLGESTSGSVPHKEAVKSIRDYFSKCQVSLNYICYVKKQDRFTEEDARMYKIFKKIFKGGEINFTTIITHSQPGWVEENLETIRDNFGNHPIVPVNFPWNGNGDIAQFEKIQREQSLERLLETMLKPGNKGVKLEVLSSSQVFEKNVYNIVSFVPLIGVTYQLISSGIYYTLEKPQTARERFNDGAIGSGISLISAGLETGVAKTVVKKAGIKIAVEIINQVKKKLDREERLHPSQFYDIVNQAREKLAENEEKKNSSRPRDSNKSK